MQRTLRDLRLLLGKGNYRRLARKAKYCHQHVSRLLRGKVGASFDCAVAVADAAGVSLDELWSYVRHMRESAADQ